MKRLIVALTASLSLACVGGSLGIRAAEWPDSPLLAAALDLADVACVTAGAALVALDAAVLLLWRSP